MQLTPRNPHAAYDFANMEILAPQRKLFLTSVPARTAPRSISSQKAFSLHTEHSLLCSRRPHFPLSRSFKASLELATVDPAVQVSMKRAVAKKVVEPVKPGMIVGLGTGSTSSLAIEEMGKLIQKGKMVSRLISMMVEVLHILLPRWLTPWPSKQCVIIVDQSDCVRAWADVSSSSQVEVLPQAISAILRKLVALGRGLFIGGAN
ncbi:hypothetical protein GOP47_0002835 [Adiantum capillus-veneris]|uniref:Ribose-5-phosphate isomerase n=1 Tax=Adiantum capillus-veneris TaxID=13818 RepID=A0A9D4ZRN3_ADICA|nr:hypothetical protein GOP47_0002835 [Adiantum capillus-veneris]